MSGPDAVWRQSPDPSATDDERRVAAGVGSHTFDFDQLRAAGAGYVIASLKEALPL